VVTEVSGEAAKNLGIEWGGATTGPYGLQFGELASIGGLFQRLERVVATIHLLEKEGKARIRSNPCLVVLDGEEREIRVTREEYYAIVTGTPAFPTTSLETISAGVILKARPYVVDGEEIVLTLSPEVSNAVGAGLQDLPVVSRRIVSTTVRVKTGETPVLGGCASSSRSPPKERPLSLETSPLSGPFSAIKRQPARTKMWSSSSPRASCEKCLWLFALSVLSVLCISSKSEAKTVTLFCPDIPRKEAIPTVAFQAGVEVVFFEDVPGKVNVRRESIAFEDALDLILQGTGIVWHEKNRVYSIGTPKEGTPEYLKISDIETCTTRFRTSREILALHSEFAGNLLPTSPFRFLVVGPKRVGRR
jgi:type II secretory pathway component HofQ